MGMGQSIGRSSWRYACSDDSDRDFEGHEHGVQGFFKAIGYDLLGLAKGSSGLKQHEEIKSILSGDG